MGKSEAMEIAENAFDAAINPGMGAISRRIRAKLNNLLERSVGGHAIAIGPNRFAQRMREIEAFERQNGPALWLNPINAGCLTIICHREHANRIGPQYHLGIKPLDWRTRLQRLPPLSANRSSIACQSVAKHWPAGVRAAKLPTGARRTVIVSTTLAIGTTGQSGWRISASA